MGARAFGTYMLGRLAASALVVLGVSFANFVLIRLLSPESFAFETHGPLREAVEYHWRLLTSFDLGVSGQRPFGQEIAGMLGKGLPADASLFFGALLFGLLGGVAGGVVCALRPRSLASRALEGFAVLALCAPVYWVGMLLIILSPSVADATGIDLFRQDSYAPLTESPLDWLGALAGPWLVAAMPLAALCLRLTTTIVRETAAEDYVRTAVAKGVAPRTVARRHTLRPALPPVATAAGTYAPLLVGNALLVEQVFNIPGVFRYTTGAVSKRRLPAPPGDGARRCRAGGRWEPARGPHAGVCSIRAYARSSRGGSPPVEGVGGPVFRPEGGGDRPLDFGHPPGLERPACRRWSSTA
jgi:peptide/nickel transport system permease protein